MTTKNTTNGVTPAPAPPPESAAHFTEAPASINLRFNYRGYNGIQLTLRATTGLEVLNKLDGALNKIESIGATPATGTPPRVAPNADAPTNNGTVPVCKKHGVQMNVSKHGSGFYCPEKIADDDGTGKPVYCKQTAEA